MYNSVSDVYLTNPVLSFKLQLNEEYSLLCWMIHHNKKKICSQFINILEFIIENWEYVDFLANEEIYMVLNIIKLAHSKGMTKVNFIYESEKFQTLNENFTKSR